MTIQRPIIDPLVPALVGAQAGGLPWEQSGGGVYDPGKEAGVVVDHFAESGITLSGANVTSWVDRAGGVSFSQGTDALRLTYNASGLNGRPAVVSTSAKGGVTAASLAIAGNVRTTFIWGDFTDAATNTQMLFDSQTGRALCTQTGVFVATLAYYDGANRVNAAATTGKQCLVFLVNDTNVEIKRGATSLGTSACTAHAVSGLAGILSNYDGTGFGPVGSFGRVLTMNVIPSAAVEARIRAWGVSYYGVAA